jgi:hypothetical protein
METKCADDADSTLAIDTFNKLQKLGVIKAIDNYLNESLEEAISVESDLILKLKPITEPEIYDFMDNLKGGTYFNMGMYSSIAIARAYKSTYRLYKVVEMSAIVSGVDYENIGTTKEFRDETGKQAGGSWYHHEPGRENKVALKNSNPDEKYVLWDIKANSGSTVKYYLIDIATGAVTPVSKADVMSSDYLTASEKAKLEPKAVTGYNLTTGELVENKTNWRTTKFEHIFWLSQAGKAAREYGVRFAEEFRLNEEFTSDMFIDEHANVETDLDAILAGDNRVSRGDRLIDNELFVDFE